MENLKAIFAALKETEEKLLEDFMNINASGKIAMKLSEGDKIVAVKLREDQDIYYTKFGKCIRFMSKKLRLLKADPLKVLGVFNLLKVMK